MQAFHAEDYVRFLATVTPDSKARPGAARRRALTQGWGLLRTRVPAPGGRGRRRRRVRPRRAQEEHLEELRRFCVGEDCPVFTGLWRYCQARPPRPSPRAAPARLPPAPAPAQRCGPGVAPLTGQHGAAPQLYAGGSVGGAVKLNYRNADVVMNWMGGLHHAKKAEARCPRDAPPSQPCSHACMRTAPQSMCLE